MLTQEEKSYFNNWPQKNFFDPLICVDEFKRGHLYCFRYKLAYFDKKRLVPSFVTSWFNFERVYKKNETYFSNKDLTLRTCEPVFLLYLGRFNVNTYKRIIDSYRSTDEHVFLYKDKLLGIPNNLFVAQKKLQKSISVDEKETRESIILQNMSL